jgi:energy-coupling factor transport system permease protein
MCKFLLPAMLAAFSLFMSGLLYSNSGTSAALESSENFQVALNSSLSLYNAMQLSTRVLAFAMLGILFTLTTDGELFIQSLMHQCHLSPKFAYGILAAFHLMPHIGEEYKNARRALRARGIRVTAFSMKPLFSSMVNCIRWSESIAMAMESKGFDGDGKRTFYCITRVHWYDFTFLLLLNAVLLAGLLFFHI